MPLWRNKWNEYPIIPHLITVYVFLGRGELCWQHFRWSVIEMYQRLECTCKNMEELGFLCCLLCVRSQLCLLTLLTCIVTWPRLQICPICRIGRCQSFKFQIYLEDRFQKVVLACLATWPLAYGVLQDSVLSFVLYLHTSTWNHWMRSSRDLGCHVTKMRITLNSISTSIWYHLSNGYAKHWCVSHSTTLKESFFCTNTETCPSHHCWSIVLKILINILWSPTLTRKLVKNTLCYQRIIHSHLSRCTIALWSCHSYEMKETAIQKWLWKYQYKAILYNWRRYFSVLCRDWGPCWTTEAHAYRMNHFHTSMIPPI